MTYKPSILDSRPPIDTGYIGKLLSDVFGVESPVYVPWFLERTYKSLPFPQVDQKSVILNNDFQESLADNQPERMGLKVYGSFWLKGGKHLSFDSQGELVENEYNSLLMPLATMVDFSRNKTVTKTPMVGGAGSVKEIYGLEDWAISINGIILPDDYNPITQQTVAEQMEAIQQFHEIAGAIDVEGWIFSQRNISRIVTESLKFSPIQGRPNMMQFSIEAVSDEDLLLTDIV